jgi:TetR/AcrR family transcriptional regulator, cholesterol catabolism regulator
MKSNSNLREDIKQKAKELFLKYGPRNVSMDDIADGLGTSKKTVYHLFQNKHAIVQEVVDDLVRAHNQLFENCRRESNDAIDEILKQEDGLSETCRSVRPSFFDELEKYFPDTWKQLQSYKLKVYRSIEDNLRRGKDEGLYLEDLNLPVIADMRLQQVVNILRPEALTNISLNIRELIDEFTLFYLRAISTEKGRKQIRKYLDERSDSIT